MHPTFLSITHPLCLRHSCTPRWQSSFQLQSVQDPQPLSYQPTIPGAFVPLTHILGFQKGNCKPTTPRAMQLFCLSLKSLQRGRRMKTPWCTSLVLQVVLSFTVYLHCKSSLERAWDSRQEQARPSLVMLHSAIYLCFPQLAAGLNL